MLGIPHGTVAVRLHRARRRFARTLESHRPQPSRQAGHPSEPIYLVHAPGLLGFGHQCVANSRCTPAGSFNGIGPQYNTRLEHAPLCQLRLARPPDESYIGSIEGLYAQIAWDGQIMITGGWGPQLSRPAVHQLWPSWHQPTEPLSR